MTKPLLMGYFLHFLWVQHQVIKNLDLANLNGLKSKTLSIKLRIVSIRASKKFCHLKGTSFSREEIILEKNKKPNVITKDSISVLVILKFFKPKISSADK